MAQPTEVTIDYNRKVQLDQFEPIVFGATVTVQLEEGDEYDEVYHDYSANVEDAVERELARRIARKKGDTGDD
jgi:hypothetical protein